MLADRKLEKKLQQYHKVCILQIAIESTFKNELNRWKEKCESQDEILKSKSDVIQQQINQYSELLKKHDLLDLTSKDLQQVEIK